MIVCAYSERIHKTNELSNMLIDCNDVKIKIYSDIVNNKLELKNLNTTYIINNYHINTYYANMIIRNVKQVIDSNKELQQLYIDDIADNITNQQEKIDKLNQKIIYWKTIKTEILAFIKKNKAKTIFPYKFSNQQVFYKNIVYSVQEFEIYTNNRIRQLKRTLYLAKNKLDKLNHKLVKIQSKAPVACFGTKALFKKQFTVEKYIQNHELWLKEFRLKRYYDFVISGVKNYTDGSMCVRYKDGQLSIMSHKQGVIASGKTYAKSNWFTFPCKFRYREQEYLNALKNKETIAYQILDKGDYFIICAIFEFNQNIAINIFTGNGINALDINIDRYAITELDANGNLLKRKVFYFDLENLTSEQATKVLEQVAIECMKFCQSNHKPLVREDIKSIKFKNTSNKQTNKKLTQFAYNKMLSTIDRCFYKNGIEVFKVNPCYTSQQGKLKYMQRLGLSIHESAAFCIGRRFLFSKEKLYYEDMLQYKKFGSIKKISTAMKKLKLNDIYKLPKLPINIDNYDKLNNYVKAVNDYLYK